MFTRKRYAKKVRCISYSSLNEFWARAMQKELKHLVKELVENKTFNLEHAKTKKLLANIFIKALDSIIFDSLRKALRIC